MFFSFLFYRVVVRANTQTQHTLFLKLKVQLAEGDDLQTSFDRMYPIMYELLDRFYPELEITITTGDPRFITASVKAMLRRKNRLVRAGRIEEAEAIAKRVQKVITRKGSKWMQQR